MLLGLVDNAEERLAIAKEVGAGSVVVDVLVSQKDRIALITYKSTLVSNSPDWFYADNALNNSNKWKYYSVIFDF